MNRLVFCVNLLLLAVLLVMIQKHQGQVVLERVFETQTAAVMSLSSDPEPRRVFVDFSSDMTTATQTNADDSAPILKFEPYVKFDGRFVSPRRYEATVYGELLPATKYTVTLVEGVLDGSGRPLAPVRPLFFVHAPLDFAGVAVLNDGLPTQLRLRFSAPVDAAATLTLVQVRDSAGRDLPRKVLSKQNPDGKSVDFEISDVPSMPTQVRVLVAPGVLPRSGDQPLGRELVLDVPVGAALDVTEVSTSSRSITLNFSHSIDLPAPDQVFVEPPVDFAVVREWSGLSLVGNFTPGTRYSVLLKAGFPGHGAKRLENERRFPVCLDDLRPQLEFTDNGEVLSAAARPELEVRGVNIRRLLVRVRPIIQKNAVLLLERHEDHPGLYGPTRETHVPVAWEWNRPDKILLNLAPLLDGQRGLFELAVFDAENHWRSIRRVLQVSDLGVMARLNQRDVVASVRTLSANQAVAAASVRVLDVADRTLGSGLCDQQGVVRIHLSEGVRVADVYALRVTSEDDTVLLDRRQFLDEEPAEVVQGESEDAAERVLLVPERDWLRPGEVLRGAVFTRDLSGRVPAGLKLRLDLIQPGQVNFKTLGFDVPADGMNPYEFTLPPSVSTGLWTLRVHRVVDGTCLAEGKLRVESLVADRLDVRLEPVGSWQLGGFAELDLGASWLDGSAASDARYRVFCRLDAGATTFGEHPGFLFPHGGETPPGDLPPLEGVLGSDGNIRLRLELPTSETSFQSLRAEVRAEVRDSSGRVVTQVLRVPVKNGPRLGLQASGSSITFVAPEWLGEDVVIEADLVACFSDWRWSLDDYGRSSHHARVIRRAVGTWRINLEKGRAFWSFDAPALRSEEWLDLVVRYRGKSFTYTLTSQPETRASLRIKCPQVAFEPGAALNFEISSPVDGMALVTLEGQGIRDVVLVPVVKGEGLGRVFLPAGTERPNFHLTASLLAPQINKDPRAPLYLLGATNVQVELSGWNSRLKVEHPVRVNGEGEVEVNVHAPGANRALVYLVDAGAHSKSRTRAKDVAAWNRSPRRAGSLGLSVGASLVAEPRFDPGTVVGGGDDVASDPLDDGSTSAFIQTVALARVVELNGDGRGVARFTLPPYEGRLRISTYTSGPVALASKHSDIIVASPVSVQVAGPKFLMPGDRSTLALNLTNNLDKRETFVLNLSARGLQVGSLISSIDLEKGARHTLFLEVAALEEGHAELVFEAVAGDLRGRANLQLDIRTPLQIRREHIGFRFQDETTLTIPAEFEGDSVQVTVHIADTPDATWLPLVRSLIEYPHGCLEQTTSRGFALLAARRLLPRVLPEGGDVEVDPLIETTISRVFSMQGWSGALSWWGRGEDFPYGSLYAAAFLTAASEDGFRLPAERWQRLLRWIEDASRRSTDSEFRIRAASVLADSGRPYGLSEVRALRADKLTREERAILARVLARSGAKTEAEALLRQSPTGEVRRERSGFLSSMSRTLAEEARACFAIDGTTPRSAELESQLLSLALRPTHLHTNEQAAVLLALSEVLSGRRVHSAATDVSIESASEVRVLKPGTSWTLNAAPDSVLKLKAHGSVFGWLEVAGRRATAAGKDAMGVQMNRRFIDLTTREETKTLVSGDSYAVIVELALSEPVENMAFAELLPGGLEAEPESSWDHLDVSDLASDICEADRVDVRDDRVSFYFVNPPRPAFRLVYVIRAVAPGAYHSPIHTCESLYEPGREALLRSRDLTLIRSRP